MLRFKTPWGRFLICTVMSFDWSSKNANLTRFWRSPALAHLKSWNWRWRAPRMAVAQKDGSLPFFWRSAKTAIPLHIFGGLSTACKVDGCFADSLDPQVPTLMLLRKLVAQKRCPRKFPRCFLPQNSCRRWAFPKNFRRSWSWNSFSGHSFISPWPRTPELPFDPGRNWCEVTDMAGFDRTWALKFWAWNHCASESLEILLKWWKWPVMEQTLFISVEISTACYWIGTVRQWTEKHCAENEISACTLVLRYRVNHRWLLKFEDEDCWGKGQTNGWYMDLSCTDWSIHVKSSSYLNADNQAFLASTS